MVSEARKVEKCSWGLLTCKLCFSVKMQYKYNWQPIFLLTRKLIANITTFCAVFYCRTSCCLLLFINLLLEVSTCWTLNLLFPDMWGLPMPQLSFQLCSLAIVKISLMSHWGKQTSKMALVIPNAWYLYPCIIPSPGEWARPSVFILWHAW